MCLSPCHTAHDAFRETVAEPGEPTTYFLDTTPIEDLVLIESQHEAEIGKQWFTA